VALTKVTSAVIKDATITDADIGSTLTTAISGSTTALSSSIATRFDSREVDMTLATASIALNESNMTLATASIAAITASLGQPVNTDSNVTFNDINSTGTITAVEVHTTFVSSSITVASGSNNFGDALDDHHSFTGSLSISGSGTVTGSFTVDGPSTIDELTATSLTATGNISSSITSTGSFGSVVTGGTGVNSFTGNVGIGTNAPGYQLDLRRNDTGTTTSLGIRQIGSGDASMAFQTSTSPNGFCIGVDGSDSDAFKIATGTDDVGTTTRMTIDTAGNVGIGTPAPDGPLHVFVSDVGIAASADADDFIIENNVSNAGVGMTILSRNTRSGLILFGDGDNNDRGRIQYNHAANYMRFDANGSEVMRISGSGLVGINCVPTDELTIDSASDPAIVLKRTSASSQINKILTDSSGLYFSSAGHATGANNQIGFLVTGSNSDTNAGISAMRIKSDGKVGIGIDSPSVALDVNGTVQVIASSVGRYFQFINDSADSYLDVSHSLIFRTNAASSLTTALKIDTNANAKFEGFISVGGIAIDSNIGLNVQSSVVGAKITNTSTTANHETVILNRSASDGTLIAFQSESSDEGTIKVSGNSIQYNTFLGAHYLLLSDNSTPDIELGTVVSTIDELLSGHGDRLAKFKISDTVGDKRVYGVWSGEWDYDNDGNLKHGSVWALGAGKIKVTGACQGGDLLESNGDGTAKVQDDDIIRSKTIAKVTVGNSNTGVKVVPCVLYCG
jgi:hypothetical protein